MTTPRFGTSVCWTPMQLIATVTTYRKKSVTNHPQIWHLCVMDPYSN